tara:strand:+ start:236 stop:1222 length:987 start_codon:yes stop_codon:yes gene_type:complete
MFEKRALKKLSIFSWSYLVIIALAVALYLGFDDLIVTSKPGIAREILNAAIGVIFVIVTTMYMLTKQTKIEQEKELNTEVFKKKMQLYEGVLQTWQKVCFVDKSIDQLEYGICINAHLNLGMIAPQDVLKCSNEIFEIITQVNFAEEVRPPSPKEREVLFQKLAEFVKFTRKDLNLPDTASTNAFSDTFPKFSETVKNAGQVAKRNTDQFTFQNKKMGKGQLVLALVKHKVATDEVETLVDLKEIFKDTFSTEGKPSKGKNAYIVELKSEAERKDPTKKRFFSKDHESIVLKNGDVIVVSNQWGLDNFEYFLTKLPYELKTQISRHPS